MLCCTILYFTFIGCFASNKYELTIEFSGIVRTVPLSASSGPGNVPSTGNVLHRSHVPSKDSIVNFNIPDYHSEDKITLRVIRHSVCARQVISEKRECLRTFFQINKNDAVKNSGKRSKQGRESMNYKYGWNSVKISIPSIKTATIETEKRKQNFFLSNLPRWSSLPQSGSLPLSPPSCSASSPSSPSPPSSSSVSVSDCIPSSSKSRRNIFNTKEKVIKNITESNRTDSRLTGESSGVSCIIPNKLNSIREDRMEVLVPEIEVFLWTRFVPFRACLCLQDTSSFDFMHEKNGGGNSHGNSNSDTYGTNDYNGSNKYDNCDEESDDGVMKNDDEKDIIGLDNENEDGENDDNIIEMNSDKYDDIGRGESRGRSRNREEENIDVNSNSDDDYVIDGIEGGMECSEQGSEQGRERGREQGSEQGKEKGREGPGVSTRGGKLHGNEQQNSLTTSPINNKNAFNTNTASTSTSIKHSSMCDRQSEFHFLVAHGGVVVVNMIMSALAEKAYLRAALFLTDSNCYNALDIALSRGKCF